MGMSENKVEMFVGIDVSKDTLQVRVEPHAQSFQVDNNDAGIKVLYTRLNKLELTLIVMEATGQLAKSDRIDTQVLCGFAKAIRPSVRALKDELTQRLDDMVTRRRQLVEIRMQESTRLHNASKVQAKSLKAHI